MLVLEDRSHPGTPRAPSPPPSVHTIELFPCDDQSLDSRSSTAKASCCRGTTTLHTSNDSSDEGRTQKSGRISNVPVFLQRCIHFLIDNSLEEVGLFLSEGNQRKVETLVNNDQNVDFSTTATYDSFDVASALLEFMCFSAKENMALFSGIREDLLQAQVEEMDEIVVTLDTKPLSCAHFILCFLRRLSMNSDENELETPLLVAVFSVVFWNSTDAQEEQNKVLENIINNIPTVFPIFSLPVDYVDSVKSTEWFLDTIGKVYNGKFFDAPCPENDMNGISSANAEESEKATAGDDEHANWKVTQEAEEVIEVPSDDEDRVEASYSRMYRSNTPGRPLSPFSGLVQDSGLSSECSTPTQASSNLRSSLSFSNFDRASRMEPSKFLDSIEQEIETLKHQIHNHEVVCEAEKVAHQHRSFSSESKRIETLQKRVEKYKAYVTGCAEKTGCNSSARLSRKAEYRISLNDSLAYRRKMLEQSRKEHVEYQTWKLRNKRELQQLDWLLRKEGFKPSNLERPRRSKSVPKYCVRSSEASRTSKRSTAFSEKKLQDSLEKLNCRPKREQRARSVPKSRPKLVSFGDYKRSKSSERTKLKEKKYKNPWSRLYHQGVEELNLKHDWINEELSKRSVSELDDENLTFRPKICEASLLMAALNNERQGVTSLDATFEKLYEDAYIVDQNRQRMRMLQEENTLACFSFLPNINPRTERILARKGRLSRKPNESVHDKLFHDKLTASQ